MSELSLEKIILDYIHAETGWGNPLLAGCESEYFKIVNVVQLPGGIREVAAIYQFDEDGFSQYDRGHGLEGKFTVSRDGEIIQAELKEVYTGPGTVQDAYKPRSEPGTE
ncbi:MAG: hypothetical protein ACFFF4_18760 [Candidatus Thorarchaeota archaeon]